MLIPLSTAGRSRQSLLAAAIILLLLFLLGATFIALQAMRAQALERAEQSLASTAAVVAEYQRHFMHSVDLVVATTVKDLSGQEAVPMESEALRERLRERTTVLPQIVEIRVIDRDGILRNHSHRSSPPTENLSGTVYFSEHRDGIAAGLRIGEPAFAGPRDLWEQTLSRRIEGGQGFAGVVIATVRTEYGADFVRSLQLGPGARVLVLRADGLLISTFPRADDAVGRAYAGDALFARDLAAAPSGVQLRAGLLDGDQRILAYRRLDDYPIVVAVSETEAHVLSDWLAVAWKVGAGAAGSAVAIGLMLLLALRQMRVSDVLQKEVMDTHDQLLGVIQSAMDAVITIDENQRVVLFNAAAERIFRCTARGALGSSLDRFIPERLRAAHRTDVERFGRTSTTTRQMGERLALSGLRADGEEFPIDASISQVVVGGRKLYTVILRDVTQRRQAEADLERSRRELQAAGERLRGIIQSAMDAIITVDEDQNVVLFNSAAEKIFGWPSAEAIGGPLERLIPERFRAAHREHLRCFGETGITTRMMGGRLALYGLRRNGDEFPVDASISQITVEGHKLYTVILRDIAERKRSEQALERSYHELRQMSAAMNDVREAERTRIARELHDELAQWLTALKMDVSWLAARLPAELETLRQRTGKMRELLDATVSAVRRIAADLRPVMLDDLGLASSIEHVVHAFSERTSVPVSLDLDARTAELRDPLATAVYRMVQEALTNIARHARATQAAVSLRVEGDTLEARVTDNGIGLRDAPAAGKSHGILGIRERAQTLGGSARIYSPEAGGTVVEILIPMSRYRDEARAAG